MQFSKSIISVAFALVAPLATFAAPFTPAPVMNVAGLSFTNLDCSIFSSGAIVSPTSCLGVVVRTINFPGKGLEFDASAFLVGNNSTNDIRINYTVSSLAPITGAGLNFNAFYAGEAISSVSEAIYSGNTQIGAQTIVVGSADFGSPSVAFNTMNTMSGLYYTLNIQEDINLTAAAQSSTQFSYIQQDFSTATPEPASMALVGGGLLMAGFATRRRLAGK